MRRRSLLCACLLVLGCDEEDGTPVPSDDDEPALDAGRSDASLDAGLSNADEDANAEPARDSGRRDATTASTPLRVLTYNVAGLPEPLSSSLPKRNSPLISPLLNAYDLALLQEDFGYHAQIIGEAKHPYQSPSDSRGESLGDGLNFLSNAPFTDLTRVTWSMCNGLFDSGSDCLTPKGFLFARFDIGGATLDVYDLHADAGTSAADQRARASNLRQLAQAIRDRSQGHAVIVAGDLNARYTREGDNVPELVDNAGLTDVWVELFRGGNRPAPGSTVTCSEPNLDDPACEHIDKILYRNGGGLTLRPHDYQVEGARFSDGSGLQLSDHRPVSVVFELSYKPGS